MPESSINCPFCGSGYVNNDGNVTLVMRDSKFTFGCPRCGKPFPGYLDGNLESGKLVMDPGFVSDKKTPMNNEPSPQVELSTEKESCFIATACFGSYTSSEVIILRDFRDRVMFKSVIGRLFVKLYYLVSPPIAAFISSNANSREIVRKVLLKPIVRFILLSLGRGV